MPSPTPIPASVGILTLNSAKTLPACLTSVKDFADVYICDGNSTDGTPEMARQFGARVEKQFDTDEPNQRIKSFGETRTRCVGFAREPWYFRVDSDETISPELADEIRHIASDPNPPFQAYKIPRQYVWRGQVIDRAVTYPNWQPRLFRRDVLLGYAKATHEKPELKPGTEYGRLTHPQYVPMPDDYPSYWKKFESGLHFDKIQHRNISFYSWIYGTVHSAAWLLIYAWRLVWVRLLPGRKLPLSYDLARFKYLIMAWRLTTRLFFGRMFRPAPAE